MSRVEPDTVAEADRPANQSRRGAPSGAGVIEVIRQVLRHHAMRQRRMWWSPIISGLAQPTLFLLAIGAGIGSQIDQSELTRLGADSYLAWIGPGILAVSAMEISARESMWPTMGLLRWEGTYRAILRTPLTTPQLAVGHLAFIAARAGVAATCFLVVLSVFGVVDSWWALAIPLVAALVGLVHSGPILAFTARAEHGDAFSALHRAVVFPLFLFSGAFFPVQDMPAPLKTLALLLPSWHGVEACRDLAFGVVDATTLLHLSVVVVLAGVGAGIARWSFSRNVTP